VAKARTDPKIRFYRSVKRDGECLVWTKSTNPGGYGIFYWLPGQTDGALMVIAARAALILDGQLPPSPKHVPDHLCRNPLCVELSHLEWVTHRENVLRGTAPPAENARKTRCPNGHPYDGENTWKTKTGFRHCRTCNRERQRELRRVRREAAA
jgi:hypothetical protein